jgi:gamma-glutamylcyclotransferase (GGCT)/AIG2-like uncharacterized protein YtfP
MITSIFVYGTLKRGYLRGNMWPTPALNIQPALARGALFDLGPYPGMTEGDDWVFGELRTLAPEDLEQTLCTLDGIEGYDTSTDSGLYVRRTIDVQLDNLGKSMAGEILQAFTYRIADPLQVARGRRIKPTMEWAGLRVAQWPDAMARVPLRLEDERA